MAVLRVDHPDILDFIAAKKLPENLNNFNISVGVTDKFMRAVAKDKEYDLINPRLKSREGRLKAKEVFRLMTTMAWNNGDPGVIFLDEINKHNPTPLQGEIETTNPCGEQPLLPYESCNLGSINLSNFVLEKKIQWAKLDKTVQTAVRFLDNVIDANKYPLREIEEITKANRKIGLGVMGFADMLVKLEVPYDSTKALNIAEKVMKYISSSARKGSAELARTRGNFPNFKESKVARKYRRMRNASVTTVAPTGTISIIAGCSSGIEPLFGVSFVRNVMSGSKLLEVNREFEKVAREKRFYSKELMMEIARTGTLGPVSGVPGQVKKVFVTAFDIKPEWHVKMQAAFQKNIDSAVSKTINLPKTATIKDVENAFLLAYKLGCKGVTVYRYGSREDQVLSLGDSEKYMGAEPEYAGGCPAKECPF